MHAFGEKNCLGKTVHLHGVMDPSSALSGFPAVLSGTKIIFCVGCGRYKIFPP